MLFTKTESTVCHLPQWFLKIDIVCFCELPMPRPPTQAQLFGWSPNGDILKTLNLRVWVCFQRSDVISLGCLPRNGIAGSCTSSAFSFSEALASCISEGCTNLRSCKACAGILIVPHSPCYCYLLSL